MTSSGGARTTPEVDDLRAGFLRGTCSACVLLPAMDRPRIPDIGCGAGVATVELARLSGSDSVGVDTDEAALVELRRRVEGAGLGHHVKALKASLFDLRFADGRSGGHRPGRG